jgi:hypothetical protein
MDRALVALLGICRPRRTRQGRTLPLYPYGCRDSTPPSAAAPFLLLLSFALFANAACSLAAGSRSDEDPRAIARHGQIPPGDWGGPHASLRVHATESTLEFDCAFGHVAAPLALDAEGRFSATGTITFETGGPVQPGQAAPPPKRARYDGWTDGRELRLTVTVLAEPAWQLGQFSLQLGRRARLEKCL